MKILKRQIIKKLAIIGSVNVNNWSVVNPVVDLLNDKQGEILFAEYYQDFDKKYKTLDLLDISKWSTYQKCVVCDIQYVDKKSIKMCFAIWDGENLNGHRTKLRFTAEILFDINVIFNEKFNNNIVDNIEYLFKHYLENLYEVHLKLQKEIWIQNTKLEILK